MEVEAFGLEVLRCWEEAGQGSELWAPRGAACMHEHVGVVMGQTDLKWTEGEEKWLWEFCWSCWHPSCLLLPGQHSHVTLPLPGLVKLSRSSISYGSWLAGFLL